MCSPSRTGWGRAGGHVDNPPKDRMGGWGGAWGHDDHPPEDRVGRGLGHTGHPSRTGWGGAWGHADHPREVASATGPQSGLQSSLPVSSLTYLSGWNRERAADTSPWTQAWMLKPAWDSKDMPTGVWEEHTIRLNLQRRRAAPLGTVGPPRPCARASQFHSRDAAPVGPPTHLAALSVAGDRTEPSARGLCGNPVGGCHNPVLLGVRLWVCDVEGLCVFSTTQAASILNAKLSPEATTDTSSCLCHTRYPPAAVPSAPCPLGHHQSDLAHAPPRRRCPRQWSPCSRQGQL